jgi:hypothetical protein
MPREPKYYVYTEQVRGEPRVWIVADRESLRTKFASKEFFKEKPCRALCDRMNADHERYVRAMIAKPNDAA